MILNSLLQPAFLYYKYINEDVFLILADITKKARIFIFKSLKVFLFLILNKIKLYNFFRLKKRLV